MFSCPVLHGRQFSLVTREATGFTRVSKSLLVDMSAASTASSSSLPPLEDRFSVILSRLDRIENSLKCLEDIKKVLVEIEGNTHPDSDGKSVHRKIVPEKVRS